VYTSTQKIFPGRDLTTFLVSGDVSDTSFPADVELTTHVPSALLPRGRCLGTFCALPPRREEAR
jgi:hypothetical protein